MSNLQQFNAEDSNPRTQAAEVNNDLGSYLSECASPIIKKTASKIAKLKICLYFRSLKTTISLISVYNKKVGKKFLSNIWQSQRKRDTLLPCN
jgi:hypothetical protein